MLELVSVEMKNFRSFTEATFIPAASGEGLTAIVGENGTGKSTIVAAIVFCLYGTAPDGVNINGLRKQETVEPVIVKVNLVHNNQKITVERSIRGATDKTTARITLNGEEQTEISSRAATQWIIKETGLNMESFTSAFVVRQKELDSLVKARPAERRKTVERLAGVERMSKAIALAKETLRGKKTTLENLTQNFTTNFADTAAINEEITTLEKRNNANVDNLREVGTQHEKVQRKLKTVDSSITMVRGLMNDNKELSHKNDLKVAQLTNIVEKISTNNALVSKFKENYSALPNIDTLEMELENVSEEINNLEKAKHEYTSLEQRKNELEHDIVTLNNEITTLEQLNTKINTTNGELQEKIININPEKLTAIMSEKHDTLTKNKGELAVAVNNAETTKETLKILQQHIDGEKNAEEHMPCPTCFNPITDTVKIYNQLLTAHTTYLTQVETLNVDIENVTQEIDTIQEKLDTAQTYKNTTNQNETQILHNSDVIKNKNETLVMKQKTLNDTQQKYEAVREMATTYAEKMPQLSTKLKKCNEAILAAEQVREAETNNIYLLKQKEDLEEAIREICKLHKANTEAVEKHDHINILEKEKQTLTEEVARLKETMNTINNDTALTNNKIQHLQKTLQDVEKVEQNITHLKNEIADLTLTSEALVEFRKDRLARLSPELSEITSDLLAEMTNGKYITVELDEDFTPYITNEQGDTRPVSWLSGGEESLVALAMRIAIGEILAGGRNGNLLILDEVLTAQDKNRRASTFASLRNLNRQTIVINHIEEATDIADKIVYVAQPEEGNEHEGSQLTTAL